MKLIELDARDWRSAADCAEAIKKAIGAPAWHGGGIDAFVDTMIYHDDINALKAPYTIVVRGLDKADEKTRTWARTLVEAINEGGAADRGADLEVSMQIEEQS